MLIEKTLFLVLKQWLVCILVIATFSNPKQAASISEHAGRKLATDTTGFISIDCGATEDYTDKTGIVYESDTKYIDNGTINEISPDTTFEYSVFSKNYKQQIKNLRSFPQGTRNCYTLRPQDGKNNNYLIRATFVYGNYDSKNQTPVFDLYLGVNKWVTVLVPETSFEIIHVPLTDYIDVCLVNTSHGVPYISALELRPLDNSAYQVETGGLQMIERYDVGSDKITRYPVDVYDRIWYSNNLESWILISTDSTLYTQSNDDAYKLPAEVLKTAARTKNASIPLTLYFSPPDASSQCYVYFHFAEVQKLENGRQRKLRIDLNGERNLTESVRLEYLTARTIAPNDPPVSGDRVHFSIYAAEGSDLPPILNAFEIYVIKELPLSPTDLNDVNAIMDIKKTYNVTRNWQGDPCLPSDFLWDGLNCSNDSTPRIISLNLSSSQLTGEIASSLSNLKEIQSLDLSYNNLTGPVPEFLGQLPNLKILKLTGNNLKGSIPDALMEKSNDGTLQLSVDNPDPCLSTPCPKKNEKKLVIPVFAYIIAVLVILLTLSVLAIYKRKRHGVMLGSKKESSLKAKNRPFTYSEIVCITNNFRTVIGEGGFGKVYFGTLNDDTEVAVKMLSPSSKQGCKEFRAEVQLLMIIHHRNLVSLVGYCDDHENMALIYEYMANGNLQWRLSVTNPNILSWNERLQIAVDAAHGLEYLHNGCRPPIIHRDLKPSNILLNENMQAKIADFGLSRVFKSESGTHVTTCPAGTPGYLGPEFHTLGIFNKMSDVYSFGIILLELITGRPAMMRGTGSNTHILQWVSPFIERGDIRSIMDPRLDGEFNTNSAWKIVEIAMSCVPSTAMQRPDMSQVLVELKECLAIEVRAGRTLRMEGHETRTSNTLKITHLDPDMDTAPLAR